MSNYIKFACGCSFPYIQGKNKKLIQFDIDYDNINYDCSATYRLLSDGDTKGCFQVETGLGKKSCKEAPIQNLDDIANIIAVMRPACNNSFMEDGKSLTQHYFDRRAGREEVTYINDAVKPYLKRTYGILAYQEDVMFIAKDLAGFSPGEADDLRSAGAKKRADLMSAIKPKFIEGCEKVGKVNSNDANLIWEWIEAGQRYLFNACLDPEMTVKKGSGLIVKLKDVQIGDYIEAPGKYKDTVVQVVNIHYNGRRDLYKFTLENGESINCTLEHKFSAGLNYKELNTLPISDILIRKLQIVTKNGMSPIKDFDLIGNFETIDLEVDNDSHLFYCNGFSTSNSHSYGYAMLTYVTAYLKAHFQKEFFAGWLENSHLKQQNRQYEILSLTNNMKLNNAAEIAPPSIIRPNQYFKLIDDTIYFGFSDIKGVGESAFKKMMERYKIVETQTGTTADKWSYMDNLVLFMANLSSASIEPCIKVGVFSKISSNRTKMLFDYRIYEHLTDKEQEWCVANYYKSENLLSLLLDLRTHFKFRGKNRISKIDDLINSLQNPPEKLEDNITVLADDERALLGMTITCSQIDTCDISMSNATCRDLVNKNIAEGKPIIIAAEISKVSEFTIKKGKNIGQKMGSLEIYDGDCSADSILVFGSSWTNNRHVLIEGNTVMLSMKKSFNNDTYTVERVWQI